MKKMLLAVLALGLTGCVNPYNYREDQKPEALFSTSRDASDVQQCILAAWQNTPLMSAILQQKTGMYYSVLASGDNVDVYSDNGRTLIKFYSLRGSLDITNGKEKRISGIKSCL
ncbi:hypothetical protein EC840_102148 [Rahnella sp. JUb53]|uniref:hypothetical protein n=1 Tax=Rahnella sp. JUb53 TaxID=2485128 RepID=UPI001048D70D|nr:hypothetical protein [Rahnella sp. JUb53]TCQ91590.1 hypothetical protein EC840_102148 [Rahnella sp. JUb53]